MADVANVPKLAVLTTQAVRRHNRALAAVADPATYNPFVISGPCAPCPSGRRHPHIEEGAYEPAHPRQRLLQRQRLQLCSRR
ncbi:hypothetical protein HEB94_005754 [Actinopolymorpha pittospori]|uniref:Uncharacterized protein n=1 Tax=Actinopolymorpha pittospori TaxID=648752 RepID=A0A927MYL8_9ACTN|nr:hypothetical protein [Actinopolymorpha pittospori]